MSQKPQKGMTRRQFLTQTALLGGAILWRSSGLSLDSLTGAVVYLDQTPDYHRSQVDRLKAAGYALISLSLYDDPTRYAAIFVPRDNLTDWAQIDGATAVQMTSFLSNHPDFVPTLITANTTAAGTVFGLVMEKSTSINTPTTFRFDLVRGDIDNKTTWDYWNEWAKQNNQILTGAAIYGTPKDRLFAGIWTPNSVHVAWNVAGASDKSKLLDTRFNAQTGDKIPLSRLAFIAMSQDEAYLQIYRDDQIGDTVMAHSLTPDAYQTQAAQLAAKGYYPICLQGGAGTGKDRHFAAIFATSDAITPRQFSITGPTVLALNILDEFMKEVMQGGGIHAAQVAVARQGKLVYVRGYTWAEPTYPVTQIDSLFRLASCSKPITNIAIHHLLQRGLIPILDVPFQQFLDLKTPSGAPPVDPQFNNILIRHLLSHSGGWNKLSGRYGGSSMDPAFNDYAISIALNRRLPISKADIASFMAGQPLQFTPGLHKVYSNFGYMLLGLVIEKISGLSYEEYVKKYILEPLGITRPTLGRSLWENRQPKEVIYHDNTAWVSSAAAVATDKWLPGPYGTFNLENADSFGGWLFTAADYVKLLSVFHNGVKNPILSPSFAEDVFNRAYWDDDSNAKMAIKEGLLSGSETYVVQRTDDISVAMLFNRDNALPNKLILTSPKNTDLPYQFDEVIKNITWPDGADLFPQVGIAP